MNKKAISPLIAWILIIGFSITLAAFVITWAVNQAQKIELDDQTIREYCQDVNLRINEVCITGDYEISANITNTGYFNIVSATFGRRTQELEESWCVEPELHNPPELDASPGSEFIYVHNVNGVFAFDPTAPILIQLSLCGSLVPNDDVGPVTYFAVIPWVKIEDTYVPCQDRKVEIEEQIQECIEE